MQIAQLKVMYYKCQNLTIVADLTIKQRAYSFFLKKRELELKEAKLLLEMSAENKA